MDVVHQLNELEQPSNKDAAANSGARQFGEITKIIQNT